MPQPAETERERFFETRLRLLSGALREFAEATCDYGRLLDVVAETLAAVVKDACVVRLLDPDGWLQPAAVHFPVGHIADVELRERVRVHIASPHHLREHAAGRTAVQTGDAQLIPHVDLEALRGTASPAIVAAYEALGIHSLLIVALRARGESIGILSMARFVPGSPPFDEHDRHLAQALADHAALAIVNARLVKQLQLDVADRTEEVRQLRTLLPICAWCKRIRDEEEGAWWKLETYLAAHMSTEVTHGICPECAKNVLQP
ncbi:MAG TPA: GAF domain-containing protein [Kofleriaceae bacterium]|nr:GAF domain-containing protein [Kofleriaceae bacterium]